MMFYFEESTQQEKPGQQNDQLLVLDGTTCLDYLNEEPNFNEKNWLQSFFKQLTTLLRLLKIKS
jgi:hypothetical protein